jgi:hypothetical protein
MPSKLLSAFTPAFLANLAGPFAGYLLAEVGGKIRRKIQGEGHELAFYRCVEAGRRRGKSAAGFPRGGRKTWPGCWPSFSGAKKLAKRQAWSWRKS